MNFFLRTERLYLGGGIYPETAHLIQHGSSRSLFGDQETYLLSILESNSAKLCWLFRAILRNLILRNLILGVFVRVALICSPEWVSEVSQGLTGVLNVLFCFFPWLDL